MTSYYIKGLESETRTDTHYETDHLIPLSMSQGQDSILNSPECTKTDETQ